LKTTTEMKIEKMDIDYARGITQVKIKNENVEFLKYLPDVYLIDRVKEKIISRKNEKYVIEYEFCNIMGDENMTVK
jgi:hypothetical protein